MRRAVVVALVLGLIVACAEDDKAGVGDACTKAQDCDSGTCATDGYCTQTECNESGKGCPSGWNCITSSDALTLGLTSSSVCVPTCAACPTGLACRDGAQVCSRALVDAGSGSTCTAHEGDACRRGSTGECCDGECELTRLDRANVETTSCVLRCPAACTKPGWSCHSFAASVGYTHSTGDFCLPDVPVVSIVPSPSPVAIGSEVTLTATATSPAGLAITEYAWEDEMGFDAGRGPVVRQTITKLGQSFRLSVRDEANQITTTTIEIETK